MLFAFVARLGFAQDLPVMDGLQLWLDATDASTVFQAPFFEDPASDGDFVESWKDKSPNGFEAFVPDGAGVPIYNASAINGLPAVSFSGEFGDGMVIEDTFELGRPYTAFIVNQYWGDIRGRTLQSQDINWLLGLWNGSYGHYANGWVSPQPAAEVNRPYVADAIGTETESHFYINGVDWTTNASPVGVPGRLAIAGAGSFPAEVSDADVSEIIIYDRVLSVDELSSMRTHLYDKYGTTSVDPPPPPPELIVHAGSVGTFAGAADLDFAGDFVYAVNAGGPAENEFFEPLVIGDAQFLDGTNAAEPDLNDVGITMTVVNEIIDWHAPEYGDTLDDDNLEFAMQSIRWNVPPGVEVNLDVEAGASYKLQLLFAESCCDRGFDIFMDDDEVVTDLIVQQVQGGINNQETGVVYTREFVAGDDQLNILLGGSVAVPDNNPILNAFTLERIADLVLCDPNTQGDLDGDGQVQFSDFIILSANFGTSVTSHTEGDINCDGTVGFDDFLVLSANFGTTIGQAAAQSVPEPSSFALMGLTALCMGCFRRSRAS
jgi:hypothetical protein